MKKSILVFIAATAVFLTACNQQPSTEAVLENESQRQEIMETIADDHDLMMEMHQTMMNSEHGKMMMMQDEGMMQMMMGNKAMMKKMMDKPEMRQQMIQNMMQRMEQDSTMQQRMTGMMANHKGMMKSMMIKMHQKGMMSEPCMQSCMKNIEGMDMQHSNGMDGMMDSQKMDENPKNDEHSDHH